MSELIRKKLPDDYINMDGLCAECHYHSKDGEACSKPATQKDCSDSSGEFGEYIFIESKEV